MKLSRRVSSNQAFASRQLVTLLERYQQSTYLAPIARHTEDAFKSFLEAFRLSNRKKIAIDMGCGTGVSTARLSRLYPDHYIFGLDKSAARLEKEGPVREAEGFLCLRGDGVPFFQLLKNHQMQIDKLFFLYPNPWPKKKHLKRRWHAHPIMPTILSLTKEFECRTNWRTYAVECTRVWKESGDFSARISKLTTISDPISPFEEKYQISDHTLYKVIASRKK